MKNKKNRFSNFFLKQDLSKLLFFVTFSLAKVQWKIKPKLAVSEACYRLALSEGQKENELKEVKK